MKTFKFCLTHILCISLLMWSFSSSWNTYAEDTPTPTPTPTASPAGDSPLPDPEAATFKNCEDIDPDNTAAINACIQDNQTAATNGGTYTSGIQMGSGIPSAGDINSEALHTDIAMSIFALLIAYMATLYVIVCPNQFSTIFFVAAGAVVVIFELISWGTRIYQAASDNTVLEGSEVAIAGTLSDDEKYNDLQMKTLQKAKEKTEEAANWAEARAWFFGIASGLMAGALLMSIAEAIWRITSWGSYQDTCYGGAFLTPKKSPSSLYVQFYKNQNSLNPVQETEIFLADNVSAGYQNLEYNDLFDSGKRQSPVMQIHHDFSPASDDLQALFAQAEAEARQDKGPTALQKIAMKGIEALGGFIPEAYADSQTWWSIIAGIFAVVLVALTIGYKTWQGVAKTSGWVRAVFFGCMMAMMIWATTIAKGNMEKLDQRAEAYQQLIDVIKTKLVRPETQGPTTGPAAAKGGPGGSAAPPGSESTEFNPDAPLGGCATGALGQNNGPQNDTSCACASSNTCTVVETPSVPLPSNLDISDLGGLQTIGKDARDGVRDMARNKPTGSGFNNTGSSAFAAKMKKMGDKLKGKYLDLLKKKGEKNPKTFEALEKEFMAKVKKDLRAAEAKLTPEMLSKFGDMTSGVVDPKTDSKLKGFEEFAKAKGIKLPDASSSSTMGKLFDDEEEGLGSGEGEKVEAVNSAEALSGFENAEQDILKDSGVSIFEQLSVRYRKSAFPIFFMKKKDLPGAESKPETTPPAKP